MTPQDLIAFRTRMGWNRAELARRLDISPSRLTDYELGHSRGRRPQPAPIPRLVELACHWKRLVTEHGVIGNQVYDARLVAAMTVHGVGRIVTFNAGDFIRYGIEVIDPSARS